ncbi:MAG TPA: hypothetical protein VEK08_04215, partial [Planctomycetota bacterium]|nr:hypothetical protein [Planctomycetota bacterium]
MCAQLLGLLAALLLKLLSFLSLLSPLLSLLLALLRFLFAPLLLQALTLGRFLPAGLLLLAPRLSGLLPPLLFEPLALFSLLPAGLLLLLTLSPRLLLLLFTLLSALVGSHVHRVFGTLLYTGIALLPALLGTVLACITLFGLSLLRALANGFALCVAFLLAPCGVFRACITPLDGLLLAHFLSLGLGGTALFGLLLLRLAPLDCHSLALLLGLSLFLPALLTAFSHCLAPRFGLCQTLLPDIVAICSQSFAPQAGRFNACCRGRGTLLLQALALLGVFFSTLLTLLSQLLTGLNAVFKTRLTGALQGLASSLLGKLACFTQCSLVLDSVEAQLAAHITQLPPRFDAFQPFFYAGLRYFRREARFACDARPVQAEAIAIDVASPQRQTVDKARLVQREAADSAFGAAIDEVEIDAEVNKRSAVKRQSCGEECIAVNAPADKGIDHVRRVVVVSKIIHRNVGVVPAVQAKVEIYANVAAKVAEADFWNPRGLRRQR